MNTIIEKAIDEIAGEWINKNQNMIVKLDGREIEFIDYILMNVTHRYIDKLENDFDNYIKEKRKYEFLFLEEEAIKELGYSKEDIRDPKFIGNVYRVLKSKKKDYIDIIKNNEYSEVKPFSMVVRDNKKIVFNGDDLNRGVRSIIPKIKEYDPNFIETIENKVLDLEQEESKKIIPRERLINETDKEYEEYLSDFYGGNSK